MHGKDIEQDGKKKRGRETHHPANTVFGGREQHPGVRPLVGNDDDKVGLVALDIRVFGDIQRVGGAHQADIGEGQLLFIRLWQYALLLELSIQCLSHSRVGTIRTDEDIAVVGCVVPAADHDAVLVLQKRQDLLAHVDLFLGDQLCNDVVQHGAGNDVGIESVSKVEMIPIGEKCQIMDTMKLSHLNSSDRAGPSVPNKLEQSKKKVPFSVVFVDLVASDFQSLVVLETIVNVL